MNVVASSGKRCSRKSGCVYQNHPLQPFLQTKPVSTTSNFHKRLNLDNRYAQLLWRLFYPKLHTLMIIRRHAYIISICPKSIFSITTFLPKRWPTRVFVRTPPAFNVNSTISPALIGDCFPHNGTMSATSFSLNNWNSWTNLLREGHPKGIIWIRCKTPYVYVTFQQTWRKSTCV